jgi:hypothetical protein
MKIPSPFAALRLFGDYFRSTDVKIIRSATIDDCEYDEQHLRGEVEFQLRSRGVPAKEINEVLKRIVERLIGRDFATFEDIGEEAIQEINDALGTSYPLEQQTVKDTKPIPLLQGISDWTSSRDSLPVLADRLNEHMKRNSCSTDSVDWYQSPATAHGLSRPATNSDVAVLNQLMIQKVNMNNKKFGYPYYFDKITKNKMTKLLDDHGISSSLNNAATGYASPVYFEKTNPFTWMQRQGTSAASAIESFLNLTGREYVVAECQTTIQAIMYFTILKLVGRERFNAYFDGSDLDHTLTLQKEWGRNPLSAFTQNPSPKFNPEQEAIISAKDDRLNTINSRPAVVGGWYFIENHPSYMKRHPDGFLTGENSFYMGRNKDGKQVFEGLGMSGSESSLLETLISSFNGAPSQDEVEKIYEHRYDLRYPGIQLPRLGDIDSVDQMPITIKTAKLLLERLVNEPPSRLSADLKKTLRDQLASALEQYVSNDVKKVKVLENCARDVAMWLLYASIFEGKTLIPKADKVTLGQPVSENSLNQRARNIIAENPKSGLIGPPHAGAFWEVDEKNHIVLNRKNTTNKLTAATIAESYCKTFDLLGEAVPFILKQLKILNENTLGAHSLARYENTKLPMPGYFMKMAKAEGGFQSSSERLLDVEKINSVFNCRIPDDRRDA